LKWSSVNRGLPFTVSNRTSVPAIRLDLFGFRPVGFFRLERKSQLGNRCRSDSSGACDPNPRGAQVVVEADRDLLGAVFGEELILPLPRRGRGWP
jgi:hypothetical protein